MDLVVNHSSDEHDSRNPSSRDTPIAIITIGGQPKGAALQMELV
jgi:hypothetical protein